MTMLRDDDERASRASCVWDRIMLARTTTDVEVLTMLASDESYWVRLETAKNPHTTAELLQYLAAGEQLLIRRAALSNANFESDLLDELLQRSEAGISLIGNLDVPSGIIQWLAESGDWGLRCQVAGHSNTPVGILAILASDTRADIRYIVARNEHTPPFILQKLAQDDAGMVRRMALRRLDRKGTTGEEGD